MSGLKPIVVYKSGPSPNPWKVILVLEELGIPYEIIEIGFFDVKKEPLISLNPNGRVPAIQDPNKDIVLWESGAIVDYLIDVYDKNAVLHYTTSPQKYQTRCWEHFQMSGQGPPFGQKRWFEVMHPERIPSAVERFSDEIKRVTGVIDSHLEKQGTDYLVGNQVTYADLMFIPYAVGLKTVTAPEIDTSVWKHYTAWLERLSKRPAVAKVLAVWEAEVEKLIKQG
ncbi:glutathione-s-transferase theta gst [Fusarium albosuccineum]|uniref:Glutathione-s-transferase theta gst n=1 Tax=Fusarium albosuccineum TaxID=1237068 RepID=A0A8H4L8J2_9HYPO|nr:glutathione-s-transferase theta gst [Fusarium albosuccineum]